MKTTILRIIALFTMITPIVGAVVVEVPPARGNPDIAVTGPARVQADEFTLFSFIQLINDYLRFIMGAIALGIVIFGGIKLITANGDPEKVSSAHHLLV